MPDEPPESWSNWSQRVFGDPYMVWHDGPEWGRLYGELRENGAATDAIVALGVDEGDSLAAESVSRAVAEGYSVPAAADRLAAATPKPGENFALRRAEALYRLTGEHQYLDEMLTILTSTVHWGSRINAAMALAHLEPTAASIDALEQSVQADDYLVRYHSANTLLRYAGDNTFISTHQLFSVLVGPEPKGETTPEHRAGWKDMAAQLAAPAREALAAD